MAMTPSLDAGRSNLWTKSLVSKYVPPEKLAVALTYIRRQEEIRAKRLG
jgi:hypothetical protein